MFNTGTARCIPRLQSCSVRRGSSCSPRIPRRAGSRGHGPGYLRLEELALEVGVGADRCGPGPPADLQVARALIRPAAATRSMMQCTGRPSGRLEVDAPDDSDGHDTERNRGRFPRSGHPGDEQPPADAGGHLVARCSSASGTACGRGRSSRQADGSVTRRSTSLTHGLLLGVRLPKSVTMLYSCRKSMRRASVAIGQITRCGCMARSAWSTGR